MDRERRYVCVCVLESTRTHTHTRARVRHGTHVAYTHGLPDPLLLPPLVDIVSNDFCSPKTHAVAYRPPILELVIYLEPLNPTS